MAPRPATPPAARLHTQVQKVLRQRRSHLSSTPQHLAPDSRRSVVLPEAARYLPTSDRSAQGSSPRWARMTQTQAWWRSRSTVAPAGALGLIPCRPCPLQSAEVQGPAMTFEAPAGQHRLQQLPLGIARIARIRTTFRHAQGIPLPCARSSCRVEAQDTPERPRNQTGSSRPHPIRQTAVLASKRRLHRRTSSTSRDGTNPLRASRLR